MFMFQSFNQLSAQVYTTSQNINGIINKYTQVTAVPTSSTLTVASTTGFSAGNKAVIIQMQGATVDTTAYKSSFGSITKINNAGNYEVVTIASVAGSTITLSSPLVNAYTPSGSVQLVTLPQYTGGATVTDTVTAQAWNGATGGIVAMESCNTITLNSDIDVSNKGFRPGIFNGGGSNCYSNWYAYTDGSTLLDTTWQTGAVYITCATATSTSSNWASKCGSAWRAPGNPGCGCYVTVANCNNALIYDSATYKVGQNISCTGISGFYTTPFTVNGAQKAEGIALPIAKFPDGRGALANGGGGGNEHNGGGGGGGNYGSGGFGGMDYSNCFEFLPTNEQDSSARGVGGYSLASYYGQNKIFMGGGGGGAEANDNQNTPGTPGGGIIIITANTLVNNGYKVSANALDNNGMYAGALGAGADGAGGAGAGGVVLLNVNTYTNALTVEAHGGRGSQNNYYQDMTQCYAPGGGGGGGVVWFKQAAVPTGVTVNVAAGAAGVELNSAGVAVSRTCNNGDVSYGARAGVTGSALYNLSLPSSCTALPVKWITFSATAESNSSVLLEWSTASEQNNSYFTIERSTDGIHWTYLGTVSAGLSPSTIQNYKAYDYSPILSSLSYYKIKQTDSDGNSSYTSIVSVELGGDNTFKLFPNPVTGGTKEIVISGSFFINQNINIYIADLAGKIVFAENVFMKADSKELLIPLIQKPNPGVYLVHVQTEQQVAVLKLVVE